MYARLFTAAFAAFFLYSDQALTAPRKIASADSLIARKEKAQRREFTDTEILEGFLKTAVGSELQRGAPVKRIRKYEGPVRVFIDNRARPSRQPLVANTLADIRRKIAHLDLALTDNRAEANFVVVPWTMFRYRLASSTSTTSCCSTSCTIRVSRPG